jgi:hypothetical protein
VRRASIVPIPNIAGAIVFFSGVTTVTATEARGPERNTTNTNSTTSGITPKKSASVRPRTGNFLNIIIAILL